MEGFSEQVQRAIVSCHIMGSPIMELWAKNLMLVSQRDSTIYAEMVLPNFQCFDMRGSCCINVYIFCFIFVLGWQIIAPTKGKSGRITIVPPLTHARYQTEILQNRSTCKQKGQIVAIFKNITTL